MNRESKKCQNCHNEFWVEPEDFNFYEKMKVPAPTWCPQCRIQRRMSWRNGWHIFKRKEEGEGKEVFSLFPQESPVKIYDRDFWWSDGWDAMQYGREYDFSRNFFEQLNELICAVPFPHASVMNLVNCRYCTNGADLKNCYFVRGATFTEDSAYLIWDTKSRRCFDSHKTTNCELGYENVNCENCYQAFFCADCVDCREVIFSKECVGCNNCFGCFGLRNKSYHIFNQPYSKEEYKKKLQEFNLSSQKSFETLQKQAYKHWLKFPHKYMHGLHNADSSGDYVYGSKNAQFCYSVHSAQDSKWLQGILAGPVKDCYDYESFGEGAELIYESLVSGRGAFNIKFSYWVYINVRDIEYSLVCHNSSNLFGCVGLRDKQYCIFNKQYTKESFEALRTKIIQHMDAMPYADKKGRVYKYGEFLPPEMSPLPYYVSEANEFFPLNDAEAKEKGFQTFAVSSQEYKFTKASGSLPDDIKSIDENIIQEVIECAHQKQCSQECTGAFRVIPEELSFLKKHNLPLPRLCPNCRHYERLSLRNPLHFYRRKCQCAGLQSENSIYQNMGEHFHESGHCPNTFETSYAPDRPEIVYCEECYQQEVA